MTQISLLSKEEQTLFKGAELFNENKYYKYDFRKYKHSGNESDFIEVKNAESIFIKPGIDTFYEYISSNEGYSYPYCNVYEAVTGVCLASVADKHGKPDTIRNAIKKAYILLTKLENEKKLNEVMYKALSITQNYSPRYKGELPQLMCDTEDLKIGDNTLLVNIRGELSYRTATVKHLKNKEVFDIDKVLSNDNEDHEYKVEYELLLDNGQTIHHQPNVHAFGRTCGLYKIDSMAKEETVTTVECKEEKEFANNPISTCIESLLQVKHEFEDYLKENLVPLNISKAVESLSDKKEFDKHFIRLYKKEQKLKNALLETYNLTNRLDNAKDLETYRQLHDLETKIVLYFITDKDKNIKSDDTIKSEINSLIEQLQVNEGIENNSQKSTDTIDRIKDMLEENKEYIAYLETTDYYKSHYKGSYLITEFNRIRKAMATDIVSNMQDIQPKYLEKILLNLKNVVKPKVKYIEDKITLNLTQNEVQEDINDNNLNIVEEVEETLDDSKFETSITQKKETKRYILRGDIEIEVLEENEGTVKIRDNMGYSMTYGLSNFKEKIKNVVEATPERKEKLEKKAKKLLEKEIVGLNESYERHQHLLNEGGRDPFHTDGTNINLVRNHIISHKTRIINLCEMYDFEVPKIYYKELPEKVSIDYMAKADELETIKAVMNKVLDENNKLIETARAYTVFNSDNENETVLDIEKTLKDIDNISYYARKGTLVDIRRISNNQRMDKLEDLIKNLEEKISFFKENVKKDNIEEEKVANALNNEIQTSENSFEILEGKNGQMTLVI